MTSSTTGHAHQMLEALGRKRVSTAEARAALAGFVVTVHEGDSGRPELVVTRGNFSRRFNDLEAVEDWLNQVGAPA